MNCRHFLKPSVRKPRPSPFWFIHAVQARGFPPPNWQTETLTNKAAATQQDNCRAAITSPDCSLNSKCGITATLRLDSSSLHVNKSTALFSLLFLWMMLNKGRHQKHHTAPQIQNNFFKKGGKKEKVLPLLTAHTLQAAVSAGPDFKEALLHLQNSRRYQSQF